ncbi:origin recognition complex subunit 4 C-terminus-domain-containing protein [Xylaria sp. CBS 124048]|nr:origin recognition complex subunit 4 C-terminus-domain-containing protein [Xylaria sp. CBS 124048]
MAPNQTSGRRKRAQPLDRKPAAGEAGEALLGTSRGFNAVTSAIGGLLTKPPNPKNPLQHDKTRGSELVGRRDNANSKSSYDISDSGGEGLEKSSSKPKKLDFGRGRRSIRPTKDPYELSDSGDELGTTEEAQERETDTLAPPLKRRLLSGETKSASSRSTAGRPDEQKPGKSLSKKVDGDLPRKRGRRKKVELDLTGFPPAVKARVYGATGKEVHLSVDSSPPKLKGILTPQKRKVGRPPKSVAFDKSNEVRNGDKHGKNRRDEKNDKKNDEKDDEKDDDDGCCCGNDDEVCVICSKPDSKPPNEIVFCDVCDDGFHQKCYNIPVIPEGDWICRTCSQEDVLPNTLDNTTNKKAVSSTEIPQIPNFEQHFQNMRRALLDRCSGNRRIKLRGQSEAYEKAYQLVEQTVLAGEGNSMMVIGGRGCGKTTLIEDIISNLRTSHTNEEFHVIRLNGFIHTDDKLALKEIWRQLGKEMDIEDDLVAQTNNYADTMASLLALLSHPTEITGAEDGVTSKSVVFIIDEFELFATHARQTLLYNLFDIAQARKAPIAVLGLTTRIDVVESLEKRVKSRFSHRYVYLSLPKSLPAYWDICKQGLIVDREDLEAEGFDARLEGLDKFYDYWAEKIETLHQTPAFGDHLEYHYYTTKSVSAFLTSCIQPLSAMSISSLDLVVPSPTGAITSEPQEPRLELLTALSDLELALLISAARLDIVAHTDTLNFAMAYDEYSSQMGKQRVQTASSGLLALGAGARVWSRKVAVVAWERLVSLGLLIPAGIGGRSNAAHGGLESKMWKMDVSLEEIPSAVELPGFLTKWCSQI